MTHQEHGNPELAAAYERIDELTAMLTEFRERILWGGPLGGATMPWEFFDQVDTLLDPHRVQP